MEVLELELRPVDAKAHATSQGQIKGQARWPTAPGCQSIKSTEHHWSKQRSCHQLTHGSAHISSHNYKLMALSPKQTALASGNNTPWAPGCLTPGKYFCETRGKWHNAASDCDAPIRWHLPESYSPAAAKILNPHDTWAVNWEEVLVISFTLF